MIGVRFLNDRCSWRKDIVEIFIFIYLEGSICLLFFIVYCFIYISISIIFIIGNFNVCRIIEDCVM